MAVIKAANAGNWSSPATWTGGVLPGPNDTAVANNKIITIDQDISVEYLDNTTLSASTAGGYFLISSIPGGVTRNVYVSGGIGNVVGTHIGGSLAGNEGLLLITAPSGRINLGSTNAKGGSSSSYTAIYVRPTGVAGDTLTITGTGTFTSGTGSSTSGLNVGNNDRGICIVDIGDVYGSSATSAGVAFYGGIGSVITCNNLYGGSSGPALTVGSLVTASVNNVTATGFAAALTTNGDSSTIIVRGDVLGSNTNSNGYGVRISNNRCILDCQGGVTAGTQAPALYELNFSATTRVRGPILNNGAIPAIGSRSYIITGGDTLQTTFTAYDTLGNPVTAKKYHDGSPPPEKVRKGVLYGPNNQFVGLIAVPHPNSVSVGTPVDGTVGNAVLTGDNVLEAEVASETSIKTRINNLATISSTGQQLEIGYL
jgi:hypothetical protein